MEADDRIGFCECQYRFTYRIRSLIGYLRPLQELTDNCCFSRRRSRRRVDSVAVSVKPECGVVEVGA